MITKSCGRPCTGAATPKIDYSASPTNGPKPGRNHPCPVNFEDPVLVVDGFFGAGAGEGADFHFGVFFGVVFWGEGGAEPAEEEGGGDGDEAGVFQGEPVEVDAFDHGFGAAGDGGGEDDEHDGDGQAAVAPQPAT